MYGQTNGVPLEVVDSGSNDNGSWLKYADGTMICWGDKTENLTVSSEWGSLYESTTYVQFGYPVAFVSVPIFNAYRQAGVAGFLESAGSGTATTSPTVFLLRPNSGQSGNTRIGYIAIGKWK